MGRALAGLETGQDLAWDSGRVELDQSQGIRYAGPEGRSQERFYWRVKVWDQAGEESAWSDPAWWEMGLLAKALGF